MARPAPRPLRQPHADGLQGQAPRPPADRRLTELRHEAGLVPPVRCGQDTDLALRPRHLVAPFVLRRKVDSEVAPSCSRASSCASAAS